MGSEVVILIPFLHRKTAVPLSAGCRVMLSHTFPICGGFGSRTVTDLPCELQTATASFCACASY